MTTTNRLCYTVSKRYIQAGTTFEINVKILLADDCKNNICDWSITADIYEQRKNGRFVWCAGGCCHEEILKRFPQFKMFVDLHLSNHYGAPMYPVENGFYHITNSSKETAINYLRITETKKSYADLFWVFCKEFGGEFEREANKKKHSFKLDFNIAFGEYKDGLCKDGIISQSLYERATLY